MKLEDCLKNIGKSCWSPSFRLNGIDIVESKIIGVVAVYFSQVESVPTKYYLRNYIFDIDGQLQSEIKISRVYFERKQAAIDYSTVSLLWSNEDWLQMIGDRESEDEYSTEESDLGTCCGDISWCRDVLINVQKNKYMTYLDFNNLKKVIDEHGGRDSSTLLGRFIEEASQSFSQVHQELSLSGAI